jgi:DNA ligase-1
VRNEKATGEPWSYVVYDVWNMAQAPYTDRAAYAQKVVQDNAWNDIPLAWTSSTTVSNEEELSRVEESLVEQGWEGAIARVPDAPYKYGRSGKTGPLLKIKRSIDFEAEVIGVYEEQHNGNVAKTNALGRTERPSHAAGKVGKGTLGGLVLKALNGPWKDAEFRCGTGFDAAQRADFWAAWHSQDCFKGEVAKIKAWTVGAKDKPRFPVFLGWRWEGDLPSRDEDQAA